VAKFVVGRVEDVPPGQRILIDVRGRSIGIFNIGGAFYALRNSCPHEGGPVCQGDVVAALDSKGPRSYEYDPGTSFIQCPWHNWEYDIRTGQSWFDPVSNATRKYHVGVVPGSSLVDGDEATVVPAGRQKGPYVAETFNVSVEHDYIVLTV
jgi:nitrite reductase/ring-hydroxylating ferredoxin subunit